MGESRLWWRSRVGFAAHLKERRLQPDECGGCASKLSSEIELISVVAKVDVKDGIGVEIKVPGEEGIRGALSEGRVAEVQSHVVSTPQITNLDPATAQVGWEENVQISGKRFDEGFL